MQSIAVGAHTRQAISVTSNDKSPDLIPCLAENARTFSGIRASEPMGAVGGTAAAGTPGAAGASGLVSSQTSGTSVARAVLLRVDREASRVRRLQCSVLTAARLHVAQRPRWKVAMVTLTYAPGCDWAPGQISDLVRHIRQYLKRRGIPMRHAWVQEFTKRGRPHYHLLLWLPLGITLPKPDKRGWWTFGMTKIEWARNAVGYIAKYASKADSLHPPAKGARMHGNGGVTFDPVMCDKGGTVAPFPVPGRMEQRWWKLPAWMRAIVEPTERIRRAAPRTGGGLVSADTGEVYRSPWVVIFKGGYVFLRRREEAPII